MNSCSSRTPESGFTKASLLSLVFLLREGTRAPSRRSGRCSTLGTKESSEFPPPRGSCHDSSSFPFGHSCWQMCLVHVKEIILVPFRVVVMFCPLPMACPPSPTQDTVLLASLAFRGTRARRLRGGLVLYFLGLAPGGMSHISPKPLTSGFNPGL